MPEAASFDYWILTFSAITVIVTIWMGFRSAKTSKSASDFFVAGRSVSVGWNASAISGEYLSAASFMGIAGMVMLSGYDALWYPVCYACGYLFLLLFIAGPLRRFGAYTIPDFAEGRYDSPVFRKIAVCFVLFIGFFYTMPQMKGAGTTLAYIFPGLPYWVGVAVIGAVITLNVALGGMKGITLVQAVQYWIKMFAISVPIFVLLSVYGGYGENLSVNQSAADVASPPALVQTVEPGTPQRLALPEKAPADEAWIAPFGPLTTKAATAAGLSPEESKPLSLLYTFSLIVALVCGTAGLPHILVRFYTNPDGVAAKKTDDVGDDFDRGLLRLPSRLRSARPQFPARTLRRNRLEGARQGRPRVAHSHPRKIRHPRVHPQRDHLCGCLRRVHEHLLRSPRLDDQRARP